MFQDFDEEISEQLLSYQEEEKEPVQPFECRSPQTKLDLLLWKSKEL